MTAIDSLYNTTAFLLKKKCNFIIDNYLHSFIKFLKENKKLHWFINNDGFDRTFSEKVILQYDMFNYLKYCLQEYYSPATEYVPFMTPEEKCNIFVNSFYHACITQNKAECKKHLSEIVDNDYSANSIRIQNKCDTLKELKQIIKTVYMSTSSQENQKELVDKTIKALKEGEASFVYLKKTGERRIAKGTLNPSLLPDNVTEDKRYTKKNDDCVYYYDLNSNGWRCFLKENLLLLD